MLQWLVRYLINPVGAWISLMFFGFRLILLVALILLVIVLGFIVTRPDDFQYYVVDPLYNLIDVVQDISEMETE